MPRKLLFAFFSVLVAATVAGQKSGIQITAGPAAIRISNIAAKDSVVIFGMSSTPRNGIPHLERYETIATDDDGDGVIDWIPEKEEFPIRSVWAVVSLSSGQFAKASAPGAPLREFSLPSDGFRSSQPSLSKIDLPKFWLEVVVVRPGVGAWQVSSADGGPQDDDATSDGNVRASFDKLLPIAGVTEKAPQEVRNGDVILAIDPLTFSVLATGVSQ